MDFGGLKQVETEILKKTFDHKTILAVDDPLLPQFQAMSKLSPSPIELVVLPSVGCEAFARHVLFATSYLLSQSGNLLNKTLSLESVEVFEHGANSAIYKPEPECFLDRPGDGGFMG